MANQLRIGTVLVIWAILSVPTAAVSGQAAGAARASASAGAPSPIAIAVDLSRRLGAMYPMWAYFGYDEPNFTYLPDGRKLLSELAELSPVPVHVRAHNLLTSDDGPPVGLKWGSTNAYTEDAAGNPVYSWAVMDRIVDTWIERGMKPLMEIGFMPRALSTHPEPYRHSWSQGQPYADIWTGWAYPPKDYDKWGELIYQWVKHSVDRYGASEVASWWWELWNEPDAPYWMGTDEEYFKLYDHTAAAVKRALPTARLGGPHATGGYTPRQSQFLRAFLEHCRSGRNAVTGGLGAPLDFVAFHAKGSPQVTDEGFVRMGMGIQLRQIAAAFDIIRSFPEYAKLPVIIGESDPEGCAACSSTVYPQNDYRNGTMFSSYTAASFAREYELADELGINLQGVTTWSFTFPDQAFFAGFRALASRGIDKPVLNVFRMFGLMGGQRVSVQQDQGYSARRIIAEGVRGEPDVNALASLDGDVASVLVWNYHDDDVATPPARVRVSIANVPAGRALLHHYRIDDAHSNAYAAWLELGAPQQISASQREHLESAGKLALETSPAWIRVQDGTAVLEFELPHQGVSLLQLSW